jgi:two-component system, cell cycle sensor histidine kinase and response regulator CckA
LEHILVVDDEPVVRQVAARILTEEGYTVLEAADGLEAFDLVQLRADALSLVLSDIVMPRLNGIELAERLSVSYPSLPLVLMSAYGALQLTERGLASPCAVLAKPFHPARLLEEVRRCLAGGYSSRS